MYGDARDRARYRNAVDVHVHRREENADLLPCSGRRRVGQRIAGDEDASVGRREHDVLVVLAGGVAGWTHTLRIAEEECEERAENKEREREQPGHRQARQDGKRQRAADERQAGRIDTHQAILTGACGQARRDALPRSRSLNGRVEAPRARRTSGCASALAPAAQHVLHLILEVQLALLQGDFFDLFGF